MDDEFLLKWHDHHHSFFLLVEELVMREQLTDVTLACGGGEDQQLLSAHSLMLSVCSPYFRCLLSENRHKDKHHIIHLHGVSARHMQQLLLYMRCIDVLGPTLKFCKAEFETKRLKPSTTVKKSEKHFTAVHILLGCLR